jgi:hypothetical protein
VEEAFEGTVVKSTASGGGRRIVQVQRRNQMGPGKWFSSSDSHIPTSWDAEMQFNIFRWGNEACKVVVYEVKEGAEMWIGGVKGGTGRQIFIAEPENGLEKFQKNLFLGVVHPLK